MLEREKWMGQGSLGNSRPLKGSVDFLMLGAVVVGSGLLVKKILNRKWL